MARFVKTVSADGCRVMRINLDQLKSIKAVTFPSGDPSKPDKTIYRLDGDVFIDSLEYATITAAIDCGEEV